MIAEKDKEIIISFAKKFKVKEIYLFGSSLDNKDKAEDIDIAVKGISPNLFFDFYGKLLRYLSKPVDLVDLSERSRFSEVIKKHSVKIYG
ncbi:MAG: nucleotidyltransferase family protein [Thermodesulfobacteriota bacterium]